MKIFFSREKIFFSSWKNFFFSRAARENFFCPSLDVVRSPGSRRTTVRRQYEGHRPEEFPPGTPRVPPGGPRGGSRCTFFWVFNNSPSRDSRNPPRGFSGVPHRGGVWGVYGGYMGYTSRAVGGGLSGACLEAEIDCVRVCLRSVSGCTRGVPGGSRGGPRGAREISRRAPPAPRAPRAGRARRAGKFREFRGVSGGVTGSGRALHTLTCGKNFRCRDFFGRKKIFSSRKKIFRREKKFFRREKKFSSRKKIFSSEKKIFFPAGQEKIFFSPRGTLSARQPRRAYGNCGPLWWLEVQQIVSPSVGETIWCRPEPG